jgi:hypothetical protein
MSATKKGSFAKDIALIIMSIVIAILFVKTSSLDIFLAATAERSILSSFIAGIFFTSIFTTAPAIVALVEIAHHSSLFSTAFFGALGAIVGDLLIFKFVRDSLTEHMLEMYKHEKILHRSLQLLRLKYFRWITFLIGGLIIASPLPDELGISLLGFSKMKTSTFIAISFIFNFIGIFCVGIMAQVL